MVSRSAAVEEVEHTVYGGEMAVCGSDKLKVLIPAV